jgi:hypothetical protein
MNADRIDPDRQHRDAAAGRLGLRLGQLLAAQSEALPHDVAERLRVGREQALVRARLARRQAASAAAAPLVATGGGTATLGGGDTGPGMPWWQRLASVVPLVMLLFGLLVIDHLAVHEQALAAAEFDAVLLADDLPPTAYSDPGFAEFLRNAPP